MSSVRSPQGQSATQPEDLFCSTVKSVSQANLCTLCPQERQLASSLPP